MEKFYGIIRCKCEKCKTLVDETDNYCKERGNDLTKMNILTEDEEFRIKTIKKQIG